MTFYCGVETRAMRYVDPEPAEHCEEEVSAEGERCARHEEPDDDYAYEAWKEERRNE